MEIDKPSTSSASPTTISIEALDQSKVLSMIQACLLGRFPVVEQLLTENRGYACQQDDITGRSPLMAAASAGNQALCQQLLDVGAPWNAVDRYGQCAGNYATQAQHWGCVNLLVDWGVRAELILGAVERSMRRQPDNIMTTDIASSLAASSTGASADDHNFPAAHAPSEKPDYLRQRLHYTKDGHALLDADSDAVMMEWERPLMRAHAQILMQRFTPAVAPPGGTHGGRVMNVGFGMGIIDTILQEDHHPSQHIIIEAHPDVYQKMLVERWDQKPGVQLYFGKWQDVVPQLIAENAQLDAIFYDTYGEHYLDLEDFHQAMVHLLSKPHGVYSFFNGLAPDNIFFHGVACQCVKLQLSQLGLDSEFIPCEIQVKDEVWEGIRRKYWHGRDTYYLPCCTWNPLYLRTGKLQLEPVVVEVNKHNVLADHDPSPNKRVRAL